MSNKISKERSAQLTAYTDDYLAYKKLITKEEVKRQKHYDKMKQTILSHYDADESDWNNYKWQLQHRIKTVDDIRLFLDLSATEIAHLQEVITQNRIGVSPYYLALIYQKDDPIYLQAIPSIKELESLDLSKDPMAEEFTNPSGSITRRYPDRLIINVTNICGTYCRHCQRRRCIGEIDHHTKLDVIDESITYISEHQEIRDVLLTGGDAFLLGDTRLEYIITKLYNIDHVEMIRLGTRTPVTLPQRITDELIKMLKKYHPIYVNTQFNHPFEITPESMEACRKLADAGINIGNQAVLLKNINDHAFTMRYLGQKLLTIRVRPYYLFHPKKVSGTKHFSVPIETGLEIMSALRGNTSGLSIPTYIINAPNGLGKIPLLPKHVKKVKDGLYRLTTWEGKTVDYEE